MSSPAQQASDLLKSKSDTRRPLIHHINADTAWLLQIPRDDGPRPFFNILLDPWLQGPQEEFTRWFHRQSHTEVSAFQTIAEVETLVESVEDLACELRGLAKVHADNVASRIDAVACCTTGTDHVNKATLLQLPPSVPIFVRPEGVKEVKSWGYFDVVESLVPFTGDWRETTRDSLPKWIGIGSLAQPKDPQTIHKGILVSFSLPDSERKESAEAVLYLPHGILASDLAVIPPATPSLSILALLHGTLNVKVGLSWIGYSDANLGAHNGLKVQRLLDAKYWIPTHDEAKVEEGFTSLILTQNPVSVEEALERERAENGGMECERETGWKYLGNGAGMVLA